MWSSFHCRRLCSSSSIFSSKCSPTFSSIPRAFQYWHIAISLNSLLWFYSLFSFQIPSNLSLKCLSSSVFTPHILTAFIWATALISSFLDHRSSYLSALPDPKLSPLQTHVHATARLIFFKCHFHLVTVCWEAFNSPFITSASGRWPWSLSHLTPHFIDEETEVQRE